MLLSRELYSHPDPAHILSVLERTVARKADSKALRALHEALLFCKAYPRSAAIRAFCDRELAHFPERIGLLSDAERLELAQTGIVGTHIYYPYDLAMAKWLIERLRGAPIEIDWEAYGEREDDPLSTYLSLIAEKSEGDALDDPELSVRTFLEAARGLSSASSLAWVTCAFDRSFADPERQQIYNSMNLSVDMTLMPGGISRTLLDVGPPPKLFIWNPTEARAKFDLIAEVKRPIRIPPPLSPARGKALLDLARGALLPRLRELYPATHGNPAEVYDVALGRGVRMILWFMVPEFRLPLETGWGLLVLKNHVPIGYGAGGMFYGRSEIAINVFDTFRGGEAAWLYSQLARILNRMCHAPWLVTRRYQLGHENEEGLGSGSYWFYDKLGFRSVEAEIRALADHERAQIAKHKGYRSPKRTLRKLASADAVLSLTGQSAGEYREFPLSPAGLAVTRVIAEQFGGDRHNLERRVLTMFKRRFGVSFSGWTASEKSRFAHMGLFALALPDLDRWPTRDKMALFDLCRIKGSARESDYAGAMRNNRRFFEELQQTAEMLKI